MKGIKWCGFVVFAKEGMHPEDLQRYISSSSLQEEGMLLVFLILCNSFFVNYEKINTSLNLVPPVHSKDTIN